MGKIGALPLKAEPAVPHPPPTNPPALARVRPSVVQAWQMALRPRSLWVALAPVLVGAALGWRRTGTLDAWAAAAALLAALLMQIITNLQNDVGYTRRGAHQSPEATGLPRATALGWIEVRHMQWAVAALALLATAFGLWLVLLKGWPVLAMGTASLLAALAYMGGPRPIAYTPFGELTVLVFFGLVAVLGSEWLLTGGFDALSVLAALCMGGLAAAALAVNNLRDVAHDARVGRRTLAVCLGGAHARRVHALLLAGPFALLLPMAWLAGSSMCLLPLLLWPRARQLLRGLRRCAQADDYSALLVASFRFEMQFAALLAVGLVLGSLVRGWLRPA